MSSSSITMHIDSSEQVKVELKKFVGFTVFAITTRGTSFNLFIDNDKIDEVLNDIMNPVTVDFTDEVGNEG